LGQVQLTSATTHFLLSTFLVIKYLIGRQKSKGFSWAIIQAFHNVLNLPMGQGSDITSFGHILANQAVGILIQASLPNTIGLAKIHGNPQLVGNGLMPCKFFAVIHRQGIMGPGEVVSSAGQ
jgi:hypothetical protein